MAQAKSPKRATKASITTSDADPQSWLYLLSPVDNGSLTFGVLRRHYADRTNTAAEFARRKLQPVAPRGDATAAPWPITAERADVLLPPHAPDAYSDPKTLFEAMDRSAVPHQPALLTYVTVPLVGHERLHLGWEQVRSFAHTLAITREVAVCAVLHVPGRVGSSNAPHVHLLIVPRRIGPYGL